MKKLAQWIIIATLLLLAINVVSEPANAATEYVEAFTFTQLKAALTNPTSAKVKLMTDLAITTAQAVDADCGIELGEGHYTLNLNGHTLTYSHMGGIGDPEGVPIIGRQNRSFTVEGTGSMVGGTFGYEQAGRWGTFYLNGGSLEGVIGSGMRITGGLAYLNAGSITGNFDGIFYEDGIIVSQGSTIQSIDDRTGGQHSFSYGIIENGIFTGKAVLDDFVLVVDDLTISAGSSMRVERRGGLVVQNRLQNLGTYTFNGGLQSIGGQTLLKSEAQVNLYDSLTLTSLTLESQAQLRIENNAQITVNGPFISRNGGVEVASGALLLKGSIENSGTAIGVPQLAEQPLSEPGQLGDQVDHSQPAEWAFPHIEAARTSWLNESHLFSFYQNNIRREEFAELVVKLYEAMAKQEAPLPKVNPFTDIDLLHVQKAAELGIVTGRGEGIFDPFGLITRQEMATMYARLFTALRIEPVVTMEYVLFADEDQISNYAKTPLQLMYKLNIIKGEGNGVMAPLKNSSRETALVISNRIFEKFV